MTKQAKMTIAETVLTVPAIDLILTMQSMCEYEASFGKNAGVMWKFKDGSKVVYTRATKQFTTESN